LQKKEESQMGQYLVDFTPKADFDAALEKIAAMCTVHTVLRSTRILVIEASAATAEQIAKIEGVRAVEHDTWKPPNRRPPNVRG
jgi:hypothetical protein